MSHQTKFVFFFIVLNIFFTSCSRDKTAPTIKFEEDNFCVSPGGEIEVLMEFEDESEIVELIMTAADLDFMNRISGASLQNIGGMLNVIFGIDEETPIGTYELTVQAIDEFDNVGSESIRIKVI